MIPMNYEICKDSYFDYNDHKVLFTNPIRIRKCPVDASCIQNLCDPMPGFMAKILVIVPRLCPCNEYEYEYGF
jgi:hypothetical protein